MTLNNQRAHNGVLALLDAIKHMLQVQTQLNMCCCASILVLVTGLTMIYEGDNSEDTHTHHQKHSLLV